jgi:hypothetical protein
VRYSLGMAAWRRRLRSHRRFAAAGRGSAVPARRIPSEALTEAVPPLPGPPLPCLGGLLAVGQPTGSQVLQKKHRRQGRFDPPLHGGEVFDAVPREARCRLQLLEEQLDLPPEGVQFDQLRRAQLRVAHQDLHVVGGCSGEAGVTVEKTSDTQPTSRLS